jgi:hypothetical protein
VTGWFELSGGFGVSIRSSKSLTATVSRARIAAHPEPDRFDYRSVRATPIQPRHEEPHAERTSNARADRRARITNVGGRVATATGGGGAPPGVTALELARSGAAVLVADLHSAAVEQAVSGIQGLALQGARRPEIHPVGLRRYLSIHYYSVMKSTGYGTRSAGLDASLSALADPNQQPQGGPA